MPNTDLSSWIGRSCSQQDEITRPALRRIASLLDRTSDFTPGAPIPPHWYAMFFPEIAPQSKLGPDGHPSRGDFLPPVPLPRRMFAGRRVSFHAPLRVGDLATKTTTIAAITPKTGRSGAMVFVTLRHSITADDRLAVEEEQDVVYRQRRPPRARHHPPRRRPRKTPPGPAPSRPPPPCCSAIPRSPGTATASTTTPTTPAPRRAIPASSSTAASPC